VNGKTLREEAKGCRQLLHSHLRYYPARTEQPYSSSAGKRAPRCWNGPRCDPLLSFATGLHRPNEGDELRELVGSDWILDNVIVANHFARRDDDHEFIGTYIWRHRGQANCRFIQSDLRIVVGLVEPHFMAGYSGGRKIVAPALHMKRQSVEFHCARILEDCRASNCIIEKQPFTRCPDGDIANGGKVLGSQYCNRCDAGYHLSTSAKSKKVTLKRSIRRPYAEIKLKTRFKGLS